MSDIAERTGRTRQNVQQWVKPPPEGSAGRSLAWRWAEVNAWLNVHAADLAAGGQQEPGRREGLPVSSEADQPELP